MAGRVLGGRYTVQDKVGIGGMATVYRGLDNVLGRTVAIKTMLPQYAADPSFAARFKQEAQAAAALQSPYIVGVYDWGKDGETYYIIMEYLRGTDLKSGIRKHGALDCKKVAQIGSQICQALAVAHRHDIIHRDIKPQNIMVQPDGNIKVMDFGIARAKNSHLTADNSVLGTAHYVSPEQTQGKELGPTSDLYSLGIVMYEAATGRVPFDGDDAIAVALKQVNEQPVPPSQINPNVDAALESIILKCMQKNPADRFQTADELRHALTDYLSGRMVSLGEATSMLSATPTSQLNRNSAGSTSAMPRAGSPISTSSTGSTGRSATEEAAEAKKKHKKHVIIGVVCAILAVAAIAAAAYALLNQSSATETVPNLLGLTKDSAISQIESTDFFTEGTVKEEYSSTVDSGKVIDQDPDSGKTATKGTKINLVISKGPEPAADVTVPDLSNMTPSEAEAALTKLGLKGQAGDSVFSDTIESGHVATQDQAANQTAKAGDTITYHLSKGVESVSVPSVVGKSQSSATSTLQNSGFTVDVETDYSDSYDSGTVMSQSPSSGSSASKGATVTITVSKGSKPAPSPTSVTSPTTTSAATTSAATTSAATSAATTSN
ncbi:MAG: Stk1 family PASTA domain-containing Ser/Thr kinase [Atopobiaceae bacterium]|jgi:serine/threonine-protein kinase|nr:Stk1 family PASTA domain-containing Ser/Thr kinase [Atopobiaceae bacterium]MCH4181465.1 Stk1 family PASTA domain-containing Ser/Thr kinase [Atopobiaceae bacterium]MCH4214992.1 Stk1 family PASTA domain-containing Ser/Thr kinase [Atopobiaceae bacterium]MCH4230015.1 Stk1 family PASTA domain-containing Ser/Thr kinase [Atopobiaceae bacterium]MCH4277167.1 Stk1 family PASTA domain-containing Ser/Thr kinase [Atopobiaceae bacterium]